jgi:hypothetical protein
MRPRDGLKNRGKSPSLDRIVPEKGYVEGNIAIISQRANTLKQDASLDDLRNLVTWLEEIQTEE